jgi:phage shock protein A
MSHDDFTAKLNHFMSDMQGAAGGGQHQVNDLARMALERQEKLKRTVGTLQESLDHLRLSVKYLVFDLEATRRENQYLRKLLAASGRDGNGATGT